MLSPDLFSLLNKYQGSNTCMHFLWSRYTLHFELPNTITDHCIVEKGMIRSNKRRRIVTFILLGLL
jgi:hypothetical protein